MMEETQRQDARIPSSETQYWEDIMIEAMESGDQERYEMARERAYGESNCTEIPNS